MTADEFEMEPRTFLGDHEWRIKTRDGDTKIQFDVCDEDMQECLRENYDYFVDTIAAEITDRVINMCDDGEITEEQKQIFNTVMLKVIG